jgi:hypothetical protein
MVDAKSAYDKIKRMSKRNHLVECCDFGKFWGFIFTEEDPKNEPFASGYDCVDKTTGEVFTFNPPDDFAVFDSGVMISVETFK